MSELSDLVCARDLAGIAELAAVFGVPKQTVTMWRDRRHLNGFPHPVVVLAATPVWLVPEVVAWWDRYAPRRNTRPGSRPVRGVDGRWRPAA